MITAESSERRKEIAALLHSFIQKMDEPETRRMFTQELQNKRALRLRLNNSLNALSALYTELK